MVERAPAQLWRLEWIGSAKKDLEALPVEVMHVFGSAGVLEVVEDRRGDTYRAVYTVQFAVRVFVLHVFQKKSKSGIATPKPNLDLVRNRLKVAAKRAKELEDEQTQNH